MKNNAKLIVAILFLIAISVFIFYSQKNDLKPENNSSDFTNNNTNSSVENDTDSEDILGEKEDSLNTENKNTLLFFTASWCPTCKALKNDLIKNADLIPANLEIKEIDYDTEIELKKQYGVTTQHTLIFIDENEEQVLKKVGITRTTDLIEEYNDLINEGNLPNLSLIEQKKTLGFERDGLNTNTALKSIDIDLVLDGGPGKDGIPSINNPQFLSIENAKGQTGLNDETMGISVKIGDSSKFYPYSILYWHEVVNDTLANNKISVTFCPLCGTAIVYNRIVGGEELLFGVSGKLFESNLLMYDDMTHSLWSQSIGEAVVGDNLGKTLEILKSDLMTYGQYKQNYPDGLVQSTDTGFSRAYSRTPYGNYETDDNLYFPVLNSDKRLPKKELLFVLPYAGESYAFIRNKLIEDGKVTYKVGDQTINIEVLNGEINAKIGDKVIPGYIEMFFSWATQHPDNKNLWGVE